VAHKLDTVIDMVRLEGLEVEPAAGLCEMALAREVDELGKRAPDLVVVSLGVPRTDAAKVHE
jgi:hypothetical protein